MGGGFCPRPVHLFLSDIFLSPAGRGSENTWWEGASGGKPANSRLGSLLPLHQAASSEPPAHPDPVPSSVLPPLHTAQPPWKLSIRHSFSPVLGTLVQHLSDPGPKQRASPGPRMAPLALPTVGMWVRWGGPWGRGKAAEPLPFLGFRQPRPGFSLSFSSLRSGSSLSPLQNVWIVLPCPFLWSPIQTHGSIQRSLSASSTPDRKSVV